MTHDHTGCLSQAIEAAERLCLRRGVRLTPIRRKVLELICESHRAVKAYDLLDRINPPERSARPGTVYNALDFLMEQGLIHRVESLNAFVGCKCSEEPHEQLLLICVRCRDVAEEPGTSVMEALAKETRRAGFIVHRQSLEVHGLCARCAAESAP